MTRIAGIEIPDNKRIVIALTYIHGIGVALSRQALKEAKVEENKRTKDLTKDQVNKLRNIIMDKHLVEGDLRREKRDNIKRLKDVGSYKGSRHQKMLPLRGQTSRVNSRTVRGNKRATVGSGRRAAPTPT